MSGSTVEGHAVDVPRRGDLEVLLTECSPPCVSIYLPMDRRRPTIGEDQLRLRRLVDEASSSLEDLGWLRRPDRDALLLPATELLHDPRHWQPQDEGLAILLAPGRAHRFHLPIAVPERLVVGERFHLHPLVELFAEQPRFLVLALSQRHGRLFTADRWSVEELPVPGMPEGAASTLPERDPTESLQLRRSAAGPSDAAFFHGHGGVKDGAQDQRQRYLRAVERALRPVLAGRTDPLVIAGVQSLVAEFRALGPYPHIAGEIPGAPDDIPAAELRDAAWELLRPQVDEARRSARHRFAQAAGTGRTVEDPEALAHAAIEGRVEVLFVPQATEGDHDRETVAIVDDAILHTLRNGGEVLTPPAEEAESWPAPAALLRY